MIVIIGESASGKTTLQKRFVEANPEYHGVVSYTTRPMRPGEQDGVDYHFVTMDQFQKMKQAGEFADLSEETMRKMTVAKLRAAARALGTTGMSPREIRFAKKDELIERILEKQEE